MSRHFAGRCFTCRGRGHRAADCPNNRVVAAGSVDESVHREPQLQGPVLPQGRLGDPVAPVGQPHLAETRNATAAHLSAQETDMQSPAIIFPSSQTARELHAALAPRSVQQERERRRRHRQVDIMSIPVMNLSNPAAPFLPPQQRQAGRGTFPGAQNMQDSRAGIGLLGNYRIEKRAAAREQAQRQHYRPGGGARGERPSEREDGEPQQSTGPARRSLTRSGHLLGFACGICGETDHMEADCAKPSSWAGDSSYCPYHRRVSGLEEHDDSKCHKSVDKCWEAVVHADGTRLPLHEIDRLVTNFVRFHRGGRPEPRCANIYSHWAMCVSRYISRNGLDGIEASLLPVRRSEVLRRRTAGQLSWQHFNYRDVDESRRKFRDTHWDSKDSEELIEKLQEYARFGTYESAPKHHQKRSDMSDAFTSLHDDSSSDLGPGWGSEEYAPDWEYFSDDDDAT